MPALSPHPSRSAPAGPLVIVVLDGVGIGDRGLGDAVARAHTPNLDRLRSLTGSTTIAAHGRAVGLVSDADMGNSEVGHNALGSGQICDQGASLVARAIESGEIFSSATWRAAVAQVKSSGEPLHLIGLLSDGNVHSHIDHTLALIRGALLDGVQRLRVHALLDGRDTPVRSALGYAQTLEACLSDCRAQGVDYQIASGGGRMRITMDRYGADWAMVERGWAVHVRGEGRQFAGLTEAIATLYAESSTGDQDLDPFVIAHDGTPVGPIRDGAAVLLTNFRGDRAIEISQAFEMEDFTHFERGRRPTVMFAGMMRYDGDLMLPREVLVGAPVFHNCMSELLCATGKRSIAIAETQKFGHVTYFWNGNRSEPFDSALEQAIEIPSELGHFDCRPWMKAAEVTDAAIAAITAKADTGIGPRYDQVRINYANGDMVGHTGDLDATIVAVSAVDHQLGRLWAAVRAVSGVLVVTADHGNADEMLEKGDPRRPKTSHSLAPVPFCIWDPREPNESPRLSLPANAGLANVAATVLELMGLVPHPDYEPSLLQPSGESAR